VHAASAYRRRFPGLKAAQRPKTHDVDVQIREHMRAAAIFSATILVAGLLATTREHARADAGTASIVLADTAGIPVSTADAVLDCGATRREQHFGWLAPGEEAPPPYTHPAVCPAVMTVPPARTAQAVPAARDDQRAPGISGAGRR